jgi:hypothetical protein
MLAYGFEVALITSSFVALIIGLLLTYADLVAWKWIITFVGILIIMFLYVIWTNPKKS